MTLFKAILLGAILTGVVSLVLGSGGTSAGYLNVHYMPVHTFHVYWSWPLFFASSGVSYGIMLMMK